MSTKFSKLLNVAGYAILVMPSVEACGDLLDNITSEDITRIAHSFAVGWADDVWAIADFENKTKWSKEGHFCEVIDDKRTYTTSSLAFWEAQVQEKNKVRETVELCELFAQWHDPLSHPCGVSRNFKTLQKVNEGYLDNPVLRPAIEAAISELLLHILGKMETENEIFKHEIARLNSLGSGKRVVEVSVAGMKSFFSSIKDLISGYPLQALTCELEFERARTICGPIANELEDFVAFALEAPEVEEKQVRGRSPKPSASRTDRTADCSHTRTHSLIVKRKNAVVAAVDDVEKTIQGFQRRLEALESATRMLDLEIQQRHRAAAEAAHAAHAAHAAAADAHAAHAAAATAADATAGLIANARAAQPYARHDELIILHQQQQRAMDRAAATQRAMDRADHIAAATAADAAASSATYIPDEQWQQLVLGEA